MGIPALEVSGLSKRYGKVEALRDVSFQIAEGEIFALIGPNGAGKTTALRIVATILSPSAGDVFVEGLSVADSPERVRERISYLPEEAGAYKNLTGEGYLRFFADLHLADPHAKDSALARAREVADLGERLRDKAGTYSKGMTRKLVLARALMSRPRLAILDEPTSGLDVMNALEVRDTIRAFAREGTAVLLSSHNMLEIEYISDRVALIHEGVIRETGTPRDLLERHEATNLEAVFRKVTEPEWSASEAIG